MFRGCLENRGEPDILLYLLTIIERNIRVHFEINQGDRVGIIGHNGAGKIRNRWSVTGNRSYPESLLITDN
jgi:ABC-type lipopolysaccharide export system ATPase subunit